MHRALSKHVGGAFNRAARQLVPESNGVLGGHEHSGAHRLM
jgi:hypothetical protein